MTRILVVGEDALCCALGERLVAAAMPRWSLARKSIDTGGITKLRAAVPRYTQQAQFVQPVLCIADTDGRCAVDLLRELCPAPASTLLLRLAITEAESWVLADATAFAEAMAVPHAKVPADPESLADAKLAVLQLAKRSRHRHVRQEMVSDLDPGKQGSGYNLHLCKFVASSWRASEAAKTAPSLARAMTRLTELAANA